MNLDSTSDYANPDEQLDIWKWNLFKKTENWASFVKPYLEDLKTILTGEEKKNTVLQKLICTKS